VRTLLKQALVIILFVVSGTGGGHGATLHHAFHDAHHTAEHLIAEAGSHDAGKDWQAAATQDDHQKPASEHEDSGTSCTFGHAHCCTTAILTTGQSIGYRVAAVPRVNRHSAIPYGQTSSPPLRPPRSQA